MFLRLAFVPNTQYTRENSVMDRGGVILLLSGIWLMSLICSSHGVLCQLAPACECDDEEIVCNSGAPVGTPVFTIFERLLITKLEITQKQIGLLKNVCELFPKLDRIYLTTDYCPRRKLRCARLTCV